MNNNEPIEKPSIARDPSYGRTYQLLVRNEQSQPLFPAKSCKFFILISAKFKKKLTPIEKIFNWISLTNQSRAIWRKGLWFADLVCHFPAMNQHLSLFSHASRIFFTTQLNYYTNELLHILTNHVVSLRNEG